MELLCGRQKAKVEKIEIGMQTRFEVYQERIKCLTL